MPSTRTSFEIRLLWPALLMGVAAWAFLKVTGEVLEGDTRALDLWILHLLRSGEQQLQPIGPHWFQGAMRDLTALGSPAALVLMVGAAWALLCWLLAHKLKLGREDSQ